MPSSPSRESRQEVPDPDQVSHHSNLSAAESGEAPQPNKEPPKPQPQQQQSQGKRSTASGSAELKTTWFNFAAPPKTPISKKIDFTKLDWNLLSTASPSIDAWLGPIDRLQEAGSICYQVRKIRKCN